MRKNIIRTLFKKELLELFRDKKTVIVMLVIPILIYPIMGIMMMNIASMIASSEEDATWYLSANRIDPALMEIIDEQSDQVNLLPGTDDPREAVDTGLADAALLREERPQARTPGASWRLFSPVRPRAARKYAASAMRIPTGGTGSSPLSCMTGATTGIILLWGGSALLQGAFA